jgi:hypothetical protein
MADSTGAGATAPSPSTIRRMILAAMPASAIEWRGFFVYVTAAALVFPKLFFPADRPGSWGVGFI